MENKDKLAVPLSQIGAAAKTVGHMGIVLEYTDGRCFSAHGQIPFHHSFERLLPILETKYPANDLDLRAAVVLTAYHRTQAHHDERQMAVEMMMAYLLIKREGTKGISIYGKLTENGEVIAGTIVRRYAPRHLSVTQAEKAIVKVLAKLKSDVEGA